MFPRTLPIGSDLRRSPMLKNGSRETHSSSISNQDYRKEQMKNLKLIKSYYLSLSHRGKALCILAALVVVIGILELIK